ncbi:zinc finger protein 771-like [Poeciliopsis prolifica]|uniref:zinc finger protein 771-like n=1 Tax=Poeciliopsis prolifica TaxID=188132 RepID=UPI002413FD94|nr:zinc finger protein 771-like [Poeciliopsis prolifica]
MAALRGFREFLTQRLAAAGEEVLSACEDTVVRCEERSRLQQRMIHVMKSEFDAHRADLRKQRDVKEEEEEEKFVPDEQLSNEERSSTSDQKIKKEEEDYPEATPIKEEDQEEPCTSKRGQQVQLKSAESQSAPDSLKPDASGKKNLCRAKASFCDICGQDLSKLALDRHLRTHTGRKPLSCKSCGQIFRLRLSLQVHMRTHVGTKAHACKTCGKRFTRSDHLKLHARTHGDKKLYLCNVCGRSVADPSAFRRHMTIHTDEKPHSCKICGQKFKHSNTLLPPEGALGRAAVRLPLVRQQVRQRLQAEPTHDDAHGRQASRLRALREEIHPPAPDEGPREEAHRRNRSTATRVGKNSSAALN